MDNEYIIPSGIKTNKNMMEYLSAVQNQNEKYDKVAKYETYKKYFTRKQQARHIKIYIILTLVQ